MASLLLVAGLLAATANAQNSTACVTGNAVHMIVARASTEAPGTGIIGIVAKQVAAKLPGSDIVAVKYPATLTDYVASEAAGVAAMTLLVTDYASTCPDSKIVMMGYSQGAHVTADVLCGTNDGSNFSMTPAVSRSVQDKVAAVVLMGDPSKAMNETFINGTSTKDGYFPRQNVDACSSMFSRMVSYCDSNDTFCDSGESIIVHQSYVLNNGTAATNFIVSLAMSSTGGSTGGNGTSTSTVPASTMPGSTSPASTSPASTSPASTLPASSGTALKVLGNGITLLMALGMGFML